MGTVSAETGQRTEGSLWARGNRGWRRFCERETLTRLWVDWIWMVRHNSKNAFYLKKKKFQIGKALWLNKKLKLNTFLTQRNSMFTLWTYTRVIQNNVSDHTTFCKYTKDFLVSTEKFWTKRFCGQSVWETPELNRFNHFFLASNASQHHYDANVHWESLKGKYI